MAITPLHTALSVGPYQLESLLGESMGEVWTARAPNGTRVVLKTPALAYAGNAEILARFRNEALHLHQLRHRHIVTLAGQFEWEGRPFLVLEHLSGGTLSGRMNGVPAPLEQVLPWAVPLLEALTFLHEHGVIHRDIKPDNILFDAHGVPCLADFGLACVRLRHRMTRVGVMLGTPEYMSPEQRLDPAGVGPQADLYSFGITLFEALTGSLPMDPWPNLPPALDAFFRRALQEDATRRYASASEMLDALLAARPAMPRSSTAQPAKSQPSMAEPSTAQPSATERRRPTTPPAAVAAMMLLGASFSGGVIWWWQQPAAAPAVFVQNATAAAIAPGTPPPRTPVTGTKPEPTAVQPEPVPSPPAPAHIPEPIPPQQTRAPLPEPAPPPPAPVAEPKQTAPPPPIPQDPAGQNAPFFPPLVGKEPTPLNVPPPTPFPVEPAARSGYFRWSGRLKKNQAAEIQPQSGKPLPGLPVSVRVLGGADAISIAESPSPDNGWVRLKLRSKKDQAFELEIYWERPSR